MADNLSDSPHGGKRAHPARIVRTALALLVLSAVAALAWATWGSNGQSSTPLALKASGTIEAAQVTVASEIGGRLASLQVQEGSVVTRGQVIASLVTDTIASQMAEADAALRSAQTRLRALEAGARAEDVASARAAVQQASAARDGARKGWQSAVRARDEAQELDLRLSTARAQVAIATSQVSQARAALQSAQVQRDHYPDQPVLVAQARAAEAAVGVAEASLRRVDTQRAVLVDQRQRPLSAQSQVDATQAALAATEAALAIAQARLDALAAGPSAAERAVAAALVSQAQSAVDVLTVQRDMHVLRAPVDGIVTAVAIQPGEIVLPGAPILTVSDLARVDLLVYVPVDQVGQLLLGQAVRVAVDADPERIFPGSVTFISPAAEFTPRNVQTQRERVNTVVGVKVRLLNADRTLKPGMPADCTFSSP